VVRHYRPTWADDGIIASSCSLTPQPDPDASDQPRCPAGRVYTVPMVRARRVVYVNVCRR